MKKDIVFILGVARSGTSALTRTLSLCGCALPQLVIGAAELNPTGVWEPVGALKLNHDFLIRHDTLGDPTFRLYSEIVVGEAERESYVREIQSFLRGCPIAPVLVIKEPTLTDVTEFWLEAARREGFTPKVVIAFRHPGEVFESQASIARHNPPVEYFAAWWLKENLLAEHHSRNLPRVFVEYSKLLHDWRAEMARVSEALAIELSTHAAVVDDFLTRQLHRHRHSGPMNEVFGNTWISTVYSLFSAAAQDRPFALASLDDIYRAHRASERAFRVSWDYFRKTIEPRKVHQPQAGTMSLPTWESGRNF